MENVDKLRVLLQHWIEHNQGHAADFEKWQKIMANEDQPAIAEDIANAIKKTEEINTILAKALDSAGGKKDDDHGHHHHHHH